MRTASLRSGKGARPTSPVCQRRFEKALLQPVRNGPLLGLLLGEQQNRRIQNRSIAKERPGCPFAAFDIRSSLFDILRFRWDTPQPAKSGTFTPAATDGSVLRSLSHLSTCHLPPSGARPRPQSLASQEKMQKRVRIWVTIVHRPGVDIRPNRRTAELQNVEYRGADSGSSLNFAVLHSLFDILRFRCSTWHTSFAKDSGLARPPPFAVDTHVAQRYT